MRAATWGALSLALATAGVGQSALAADADLQAQMRALIERVNALEKRNQELESQVKALAATKPAPVAQQTAQPAAAALESRVQALEAHNAQLDQALQSDRLSENEPELATRLKAAEIDAAEAKSKAARVDAFDGVSVEGSLVGVAQQLNAAGAASGKRESRLDYRGDLNLTVPAGEVGASEGKFFAQLRFGQGEGVGLRPAYTGAVNSVAFQTAASQPDDSFAILAQAWYQLDTPLGDNARTSKQHMEFTVGKMDPFVFFDQNAIADDESSRFLNNALVHNPLLDSGGDVGADTYGFTPGVRVAYVNEENGSWGASMAAFSSGQGANFSGSPAKPFIIGQLETQLRPWVGLEGNYRLYAWQNGQGNNYDGRIASHQGWGFSLDQRVADAVTLFSRYGQQVKGDVRFNRAFTLGSEIGGSYWGRSADAIGIAGAWLKTSKGYRAAATTLDLDGDGSPDPAASGAETIAELYYRYQLNPQIALSPDFQLIRRPQGQGSARAVKAVGLRAALKF